MRGGREAVQALISRDVSMLQQGSSGVILAWAQGAKDLAVIGATGNKLDYIFVSSSAIKKPADLKGKRVGITQMGSTFHYILGNLLEKRGMSLNDVKVVPLGSVASMRDTVVSHQIESAFLVQPHVAPLEKNQTAKVLLWAFPR